jgi:colicin import membrane protein
MSNEKDYREKIEQHRQQVEHDEVPSRRTRTRRNEKNKKQPKSPLLSILVFTFILIPLAILAYVWFIYEPKVETKVNKENENPTVQIEKNDPVSSATNEEKDKAQTEKDADQNNSDADKGNQNAGSETQDGQNGTDVEVDKEKEAEIAAAAAEAEKKLKEQKEKEEAEKKAQADKKSKASAKTHVVQPGDTLYSISVKYYQNGSMVEKIKAANNLKSDSIPLGKELILP